MAQALSLRVLAPEARGRVQFRPSCGICGQSGTGTHLVFACEYQSTAGAHSRTVWGINNGPLNAHVQQTWSNPLYPLHDPPPQKQIKSGEERGKEISPSPTFFATCSPVHSPYDLFCLN
jgi:hypothetical protein